MINCLQISQHSVMSVIFADPMVDGGCDSMVAGMLSEILKKERLKHPGHNKIMSGTSSSFLAV